MNPASLSRRLFALCVWMTAGVILYGCRAATAPEPSSSAPPASQAAPPPPRPSSEPPTTGSAKPPAPKREHHPTKAAPPPASSGSHPPTAAEAPPPPPPVPAATATPPPQIAAFPWPPPQASSRIVLAALTADASLKTFGDVDRKLSGALLPRGYIERSYFSVPGGFALVTRLEQTYGDGRSMPPPARFSAELLPPSRFADYLRALFSANPGYYRVIVFIATAQGIIESNAAPSEALANSWIHDGVDVLPASIASQPTGGNVHCTALIYQFRRSNASSSDKPELVSDVDPVANLTNAGLWQALN